MRDVYQVSWTEIYERVEGLTRIYPGPYWGVPRGGSVIAGLTDNPAERVQDARTIVDDIVDSGATRTVWTARHPDKHFAGLFDKTATGPDGSLGWVLFPWEETAEQDIASVVTRTLEYIGEDPRREGLRDTPARVVRSWQELYGGYDEDPASVFKVFEDGACDEMVVLRDIGFYSTCEHHMLPFHGKAHIGYIPNGKVVGVSKMARLVEVFARRLQVQERLTTQIADAMVEHLQPKGVIVVLEAEHLCMVARGVKKQATMTTSAIRGGFETAATRSEFYSLIGR